MKWKFWKSRDYKREFEFMKAEYELARDALKAAIPIVQFAVANLDPSGVVWPYEQLRDFGQKLRIAPEMNIYMVELGDNLIEFAGEFKRLRTKYENESALRAHAADAGNNLLSNKPASSETKSA